jgi:hypothetical protein
MQPEPGYAKRAGQTRMESPRGGTFPAGIGITEDAQTATKFHADSTADR